MQLLTQKQSLWKELIPDWEELNEKKQSWGEKHIQQYAKYRKEKEHSAWNYKYD